MNKEQMKTVTTVFGSVVRKVAESAVHAAVFAYVSKKVTNLMTKHEDANKEKVRIDDTANSAKTSTMSTERI
jgi:hypothetical protein